MNKNRSFQKKLSVWLLCLVSGFCIFTHSAIAYTPDSSEILQLMVEQIGKSEGLRVMSHVYFYPADQSDSAAPNNDHMAEGPFDQTAIYRFCNRFRSQITGPLYERIHVHVSGRTTTAVDGRIVFPAETTFDLYKEPLLYRDAEDFEKRLKNLGVDISVTSLGRFTRRQVLIIGAQYPDEVPAQLWVDKKTFLPVRWMIGSDFSFDGKKEGREKSGFLLKKNFLDIRFSQWKKIGDILYPKKIDFFQNKILVRRMEAREATANPDLPDHFFDISHLPTGIEDRKQPGNTEVQTEIDEVEAIIEEFRKMYEPF
ncbi:hypothetical protein QUF76_00980 [Desulfobacterales bacterium HSG16]|nr:hypothetical protein [Desulfobacterales bacterium HSG16]